MGCCFSVPEDLDEDGADQSNERKAEAEDSRPSRQEVDALKKQVTELSGRLQDANKMGEALRQRLER